MMRRFFQRFWIFRSAKANTQRVVPTNHRIDVLYQGTTFSRAKNRLQNEWALQVEEKLCQLLHLEGYGLSVEGYGLSVEGCGLSVEGYGLSARTYLPANHAAFRPRGNAILVLPVFPL